MLSIYVFATLWSYQLLAKSIDAENFAIAHNRQFWSALPQNLVKCCQHQLDLLLSFEGLILGDPHPGNFGALPGPQGWELVPIDFDDGGHGPFLGDLIRFLSTVNPTHLPKLITAYHQGVCGNRPTLPSILQFDATWESASNDIDFTARPVPQFFRGRRPFTPIGRPLLQQLAKFLPPGNILDAQATTKADGGSALLPRYWILHQAPNNAITHYEFKFIAPSALTNYTYPTQEEQTQRFSQLISVYWPPDLREQTLITPVAIDTHFFLLRTRWANPIANEKLIQLPGTQLLALQYWGQLLGFAHGQQEAGAQFCQAINQLGSGNFQRLTILASEQVRRFFQQQAQDDKRGEEESFPGIFTGELRYRLDRRSEHQSSQRWQQKMRAQLHWQWPKNPGPLSGELALATGDDYNSSHLDLGQALDPKMLKIDLAALHWQPPAQEQIRLTIGKMQLPFFRVGESELLWDNSISPEGLAISYHSLGKNIFLHAGRFVLRENYRTKTSQDIPDQQITSAQVGMAQGYGRWLWQSAIGRLITHHLANVPFKDFGIKGPLGNSSNGPDNFLRDFNLWEFPCAITFFAPKRQELQLFFHGIYNTNASSAGGNNHALRAGIVLENNLWELLYAYRKVGADGVWGYLTESNFGLGGAGQKGSEISVKWKGSKKFFLRLQQQWARHQHQQILRTHADWQLSF